MMSRARILAGLLAVLLAVPAPLVAAEEATATSSDLAACRKVLDALKLQLSGNTVLCPNNEAMGRIAKALKFESTDALAADVANPSSGNRAAVERVMKLHIIPGIHLKKDLEQSGGSKDFKTWDGSQTVKVEREDDGDIEAEGSDGNDFDLIGYDLTFDGAYKPGDAFVVHAIEGVLLPQDAPFTIAKEEGEKKEEGDKTEEGKKEEEKKEAPAAEAKGVCALLVSAGVDLAAKGLACPNNEGLSKLLDVLKIPKDAAGLLAQLHNPTATKERLQQVKLAAACEVKKGLLKC